MNTRRKIRNESDGDSQSPIVKRSRRFEDSTASSTHHDHDNSNNNDATNDENNDEFDSIARNRRIANLTDALTERGMIGRLSTSLELMRDEILSSRSATIARVRAQLALMNISRLRAFARERNVDLFRLRKQDEITSRIVDATSRTFNEDADLAVETFLASDALRDELAAHAQILTVLRQFRHEDLCNVALSAFHSSLLTPRDAALFAVNRHRADLFHSLVRDVEIYSWDKHAVQSRIACQMRESFKFVTDEERAGVMPDDENYSKTIVDRVAKFALKRIATWKAEQEGLLASGFARKAEMNRLLAARGFAVEAHHVLVNVLNGGPQELDVRHEIAVEFSGQDPPLPIGVSMECEKFVVEDGRVVNLRHASVAPVPGPVDIALFQRCAHEPRDGWRLNTLYVHDLALRWSPRLAHSDLAELSAIINDSNCALYVPVGLEMRSARRAALLAALRSSGIADRRIPFTATRHVHGACHVFLGKKMWPRPRAVRAATVGDVALAQQTDVFAALPQLVIEVICAYLIATRSRDEYIALAEASDAFAIGAARWEMIGENSAWFGNRTAPKRMFVLR
jgi:hypothetical protein